MRNRGNVGEGGEGREGREGGKNSKKSILHSYTVEHIGKALTRQRLGGTCFINITGEGETLFQKEMTAVAKELLVQGHYLAITTNGTLSKRFDEFIEFPQELLRRLQFTFSMHWIELTNRDLVGVFFDNIDKIRKAGVSFSIRVSICDEYLPHIEEIKAICLERTGALPHALPTVDFSNQVRLKHRTKLELEQYIEIGECFQSVQFDFKNDILFVKQKKFCYAGDWFFHLNLPTGMICPCYAEEYTQNIYDNIKEPIQFKAIGSHCKSPYCEGCCFILPFGLIPGIKTPTAREMFERVEANSHSEEMRTFMSSKLYESNKKYSLFRKMLINSHFYKKKLEQYKNTSIFIKPKANVALTALNSANISAKGCEIIIKKIIIDRKEYAPQELFGEDWKTYERGYLGWNSYTPGLPASTAGEMPKGRYRAIVFQKNKWRGFVSIERENKQEVLDCYANLNDGELLYTF
jgi:hypothetical protein